MKTEKLLLLYLLFLPLFVRANEPVKIADINIGSEYADALKQIEDKFGKASIADENQLVYNGLKYNGFTFNKVVFNFKNAKLNGARFIINTKNKAMANKYVKQLSDYMGQKYPLSIDMEDDSFFYLGGPSPKGIGHLFSICPCNRQGAWSAELRFGPF